MTTAGEPQIETLLARIEALEAKKAEPPPFWRNTAAVGILGGVIAIIPASLTAIQEYYQTEREVRLNTTKYAHERTVSYLDRALSPETTEAKQAQVLRFLSQLPGEQEQHLRDWADGELTKVEDQVAQLKKEVEHEKKKIESLESQKEVLVAETEQIAVEAASRGNEESAELLIEAKRSKIENKNIEIAKSESKVQVAARRAGAPELAESMIELPKPMPAGGAKSWRVQIAADRSKAAIEQAAAVASGGGMGKPEIYSKAGMYYLLMGKFESREAATDRVADYKRLLGQGAIVKNVDLLCPSPRKGNGLLRCGD